MIKFRRDKDGNLFAVKDGVVISAVVSMGDITPKEEKKNGSQGGQNRKPHR